MSRVKLIDVADRAGVSKSTVSQYLNGRFEYMSVDTKERIEAAVKELGYIPNPIARSLKTQKTSIIGVLVDDMTGPITSKIIRGIDDYCKKMNYNILIHNTDNQVDNERRSIEILKNFGVDGMIISSTGKNNDLINKSDQSGTPIVHINRSYEDLSVNTVLSDFYHGAKEAIEYVLSLGHTRVGILTRPYEGVPSRKSRIDGCLDTLKDKGITIDKRLIGVVERVENIGEIYKELINQEEPPTVIFSLYSRISIPLLDYLNSERVEIPNEISIIAFDDLPMSHLFKAPLTVINQQSYTLGTESAKLLLEKIKTPKKEMENITTPCKLIIRESCKKV